MGLRVRDPLSVSQAPFQGFTNDVVDPGSSNADATITYTADPGNAHVIGEIHYSYDGTPTGGNLTIEDGDNGNLICDLDITAGGPGRVIFTWPIYGTGGWEMVVTLAAGGSGVTGKIGRIAHKIIEGIPMDGTDWSEPDNSGLFMALD